MTKPKEKFLFDDDLLEEMHRKKEIEEKILASRLMWAIFRPNGRMISHSIKGSPLGAWGECSITSDNRIEKFKQQGYQCRQITIKALKK